MGASVGSKYPFRFRKSKHADARILQRFGMRVIVFRVKIDLFRGGERGKTDYTRSRDSLFIGWERPRMNQMRWTPLTLCLLLSALAGVFVLMLCTQPSPALADGIDDIDYNQPYYSDSDGLDRPMPPALNYLIQQSTAAAAKAPFAPAAQPPKKPGFFSRLLGRAKRQVSLPIDQVEKVPQQPESPPKTNPTATYGILKLPVTVGFNEKTLPPGIYAVESKMDPTTRQIQLAIQLQNRVMLQVPAFISNMGPQVSLPLTPVSELADGDRGQSGRLNLQFVDHGQHAILVYNEPHLGRELQSLPLDVLP